MMRRVPGRLKAAGHPPSAVRRDLIGPPPETGQPRRLPAHCAGDYFGP